MKKIVFGLLLLPAALSARTVTLGECQTAARENYPLIAKYDLIAKTTDCTVANVKKSWLPQVTASAQATLQSDVVSLPDMLQSMMEQFGTEVKGLRKDQYRVALDVTQTVYDGGNVRNRQQVARLQGEVETAQNDVNLYAVAERVNNLFFSALLIEEKISLNDDMLKLLLSNERRLESMFRNGAAMQSDVDALKAERLGVQQQQTELQATRKSLLRMLAVFCGMDEISGVERPAELTLAPDGAENNRPELRMIDAQLKLADAQERLLNVGLRPRVSVFAQGFYGYPGFDMYHDMFEHNWTLNGMVGARLTWNINALYTRRNDRTKISLQRESAENQRDIFLFNNKMQQVEQRENLAKFSRLLADDQEIIDLRTRVRQSAESKLSHGVIDVNNLLQEITRENKARTDFSIHQTEMLKNMYDLKYTLNK